MMRREDYKAVKHMDKTQMEKYLQTVYQRGFDAGVKSVIAQDQGRHPGEGRRRRAGSGGVSHGKGHPSPW